MAAKKKTMGVLSSGTRVATAKDRVRAKVKDAEKAFKETQGKKGRELAKKVSNVGNPKKTVQTGTKTKSLYTYNKPGEFTSKTTETYGKAYSAKQEKKIKATKKALQEERGRAYYSAATRAAELGMLKKKKK